MGGGEGPVVTWLVAPAAARSLLLAALAAALLVIGATALRLIPIGVPGPTVSAVVPLLWGAGAVIVLALTRTWAPAVAWGAAIVGATAATLSVIGVGSAVRAFEVIPGPWLDLAMFAALVVPAAIAGAYATADARAPRSTLVACWIVVVALSLGLVGRSVARAISGEQESGIPKWLWLLVVALLAAIGVVRDVRPALFRTRERVAAGEAAGRGTGHTWSLLRVFVDEVVPGRDVGRAEAVETERTRLAADLHAEVLPSLRRALVEAESGGTVERLAADLRSAVEEVESLLVSRRSIVLEEMGLRAAIEWLAERIEDRSDVRVEIEVEGDNTVVGEAVTRPPRDAERVAFRVAQLALDNVVRHVPEGVAVVTIAVAPTEIRLRIEDDGPSRRIDEAAAVRAGRRGIADMRAEAASCGATLALGPGRGGRGTAVALDWREPPASR
jgi:signal transduction histidine kinase